MATITAVSLPSTAAAAPTQAATLARPAALYCTESAGWNLEQGSWLDSHIWWSRKVLAWKAGTGRAGTQGRELKLIR